MKEKQQKRDTKRLEKVKNAPGLYVHSGSGIYYERIQIPGKDTFESLRLSNKNHAQVLLTARRASRQAGRPMPIGVNASGISIYADELPAPAASTVVTSAAAQQRFQAPAQVVPSPTQAPAAQTNGHHANEQAATVHTNGKPNGKPPLAVFCSEILKRYEDDHYPNKKGNPKWKTEEERLKHCETPFLVNLHLFFDEVRYEDVIQDTFDSYRDKRIKEVKKGCSGLRAVDRELNTFAAACKWAVRKGIAKWNAAGDRVKFYDKKNAKKAKDRSPNDLEELHKIAGDMMALGTVEAEACGWQYLVEGYTSLRTSEALVLQFKPHQNFPGAVTPDGKSLRVHHVKLTLYQNHFARVTKGLKMILDAHEVWHKKRFPEGQKYMFPGHRQNSHLHRTTLTNLLKELWDLPESDPRRTLGWYTSHGARGLFVWMWRRMSCPDADICWMINHVGGEETLRESYGRPPEHWLTGEAPLPKDYDWVPKCPPAWTKIKYEDENGKPTGGHKRVS